MEFHLVKVLLLEALEAIEGARPGDSIEQLRLQSFGAYELAKVLLDRSRPATWISSRERRELIHAVESVIKVFWNEVEERRMVATAGCDVPR